MVNGSVEGIEPYGPFTMSPASMVFHYGQAIFEGMKAYRQMDGEVSLFRPGMNIARFNKSAVRMCMPEVPEDLFMEALAALVGMDSAWGSKRRRVGSLYPSFHDRHGCLRGCASE